MDANNKNHILTVNAGSSSIKLALFDSQDVLKPVFEASIENIGQPTADFAATGANQPDVVKSVTAADHGAAAFILLDWLKQLQDGSIAVIGHRIVHGGPKYYEPRLIDDELLAGLRELTIFDPEHLPVEIQLIQTFQRQFPDVKQVACFDTAFHHNLPDVARLLPIPRHYEAAGVRRYGFHGLSYEFVLEQLKQLDGAEAANGRLILAHLGNGVSLAAVHSGQSIDTTMGLTPAAGVPMSSRSGDLDPGLGLYLSRSQGLDAEQFNDMVNFKSGLLGISETTSDMKKLLEAEAEDSRAKLAIDLFCYQIKKSIGSLAAALGGLDTLVFTGGMGEQAPKIRAGICDGLDFLGIEIDDQCNQANAEVISADGSRVKVRVIHTNEASTIAKDTWQLVNRQEGGHENQQ